jgi:hypothetical protein
MATASVGLDSRSSSIFGPSPPVVLLPATSGSLTTTTRPKSALSLASGTLSSATLAPTLSTNAEVVGANSYYYSNKHHPLQQQPNHHHQSTSGNENIHRMTSMQSARFGRSGSVMTLEQRDAASTTSNSNSTPVITNPTDAGGLSSWNKSEVELQQQLQRRPSSNSCSSKPSVVASPVVIATTTVSSSAASVAAASTAASAGDTMADGSIVIEEKRRRQNGADGYTYHRYLRGRMLGKGGFAKVYLCTALDTGKNYAVKIVPKANLVKTRARQKVRSLCELIHVCVCAWLLHL